jgi:cytosine/adenosine deaminase-related metal-dependent hydrolase
MAISLVEGAFVLERFTSAGEPIIHENAAVLVDGERITEIEPSDRLRARFPDAVIHGGRGAAVVPGFINAHHHIGLTPLQLGSPDHPLELWFASRIALRDVDLYLDTLYSAFEMIASGVTTVQHLHSRAPGRQQGIVNAAHAVIQAYRDLGMRASYSMALRDQNRLVYEDDQAFLARLPQALRSPMAAYFARFTLPLSDQIEVVETLRAEFSGDSLIRIQLAPSNLHWLSEAALETVAEVSDRLDMPMHMHLLETPYQKAYAQKRAGGSALRYLERLGMLGPRLTLGHGVWMTEADIEACALSGTKLCHNCSSNLRLKSGIAPINRFFSRGVPIAIGIDEAGINDDRDMLQEMRLVLRMHREAGIDAPHPSPAAIVRMATEYGATTTPFGKMIGRLSPGSAADLVIIDWDAVTRPWQSPDISFIDVLVQRARTSAVRSVMIAGKLVYDEGRFLTVDRDMVLNELVRKLAEPLTREEEERRKLARDVFPHVRAFYDGYLAGLPFDPFYRPNSRL